MADSVEYRIEELIDELGLAELLEAVAGVAREKAIHIRANYDDKALAAMWAKDADRIDALASKLEG